MPSFSNGFQFILDQIYEKERALMFILSNPIVKLTIIEVPH